MMANQTAFVTLADGTVYVLHAGKQLHWQQPVVQQFPHPFIEDGDAGIEDSLVLLVYELEHPAPPGPDE